MITPELLDFIEAELKAGQTLEGLSRLLHEGGGWTTADVEEAMTALQQRKRPVSVAGMRAQSSSRTPSPVFMPGFASVSSLSPKSGGEKPEPTSEPRQEPAMRMGEILPPDSGALAPYQQPSVPSSPPAPLPPPPPVPAAPISSVSLPHALSPVAPSPIPVMDVPVVEEKHPGLSLRTPTSSAKKAILGVSLLALLVLIGLGGFFLVKGIVPEEDKTIATMSASIPGIQSFRYDGEMTLNFSGEVTDALAAGFPLGYTGSARVALKYEGRADLAKGFDGTHQFGITADLRSGESQVAVKSSVELRIIGDTYYLKVSNPPEIKDIDLSRLRTYWIAVSPSDIAARFGGVAEGDRDAYGAFGASASGTPTIRGFIGANPPFSSFERVGEEDMGGVPTVHYRFVGDPERLFALLGVVFSSVTGSSWEMSETEAQNVKTLLSELKGDIWIDPATYLPRKIVFRHPLKSAVSGITLDGTLDVEQQYGEYNGKVTVVAPRPVITYGEFSDDVRRQSERAKATGDARRVFDAQDIASALEVYRANHDDAYPISLDALVSDGLLSSVPADPDGGTYLYAPFIAKGKTTKKSLCTTATSTCAFFHLGVTLASSSASTTGEMLEKDTDLLSEVISGADTKGCAKEAGKACYDLTPSK